MAGKTAIAPVMAICAALTLTACGGYDVQLNGGLFEAMGVDDLGKNKAEPQVARRTGIVMPPTTASLPVPGSGAPPPQPQVAGAAPDQAWPVDPETTKGSLKQAQLQEHLKFCEEARHRVKVGQDSVLASGPLGSCHESIVKNFTGQDLYSQNTKEKKAAGQ